MIADIAKHIRLEVFKKLDSMFNHRKQREGLISLQNALIDDLKHQIDKWVEFQTQAELRYNKIKLGGTKNVKK